MSLFTLCVIYTREVPPFADLFLFSSSLFPSFPLGNYASSCRQFQCRQCQDLLENNLAHKRPIEVLVGKKNLEVRPLAVNKGEIVKRILYHYPEAEFVFCAGDDKVSCTSKNKLLDIIVDGVSILNID